jgi:protein-histidine N-methyltransferase
LPVDGGSGTVSDHELVEWSRARGVVTALCPATFGDDKLRGCAAARALSPGEVVAEVPSSAVVTVANARASARMQPVLQALGESVSDDLALILWTMMERADAQSEYKPLLQLNEGPLFTALTLPDAALSMLDGTNTHAEVLQLRHAARQQFQATLPRLCEELPHVLCPASAFGYSEYVSAVELWQAYGMQVVVPGTTEPQTVLMPMACLLNHSCFTPHIVRFSTADADGVFRLRTVRPCDQGGQVFLSYGALTNAQLLTFYGFAVACNPCDTVEFAMELPDEQEVKHLLRCACPLPHRLLATLRTLCSDNETGDPAGAGLSAESDIAALSTLSDLVAALQQGLRPVHSSEATHPAGRHCALVVASQRDILVATARECSRQLKALGVIHE